MTCECGNPNCDGQPQHANIAQMIRDHGQFLVAVLGDEEHAPFIYTIGRTEQGQPELLIKLEGNAEIQAAGRLLNYLGPRDVQPGHRVGSMDLDGTFLAVKPPEEYDDLHESFVVQADHYYGRPVEVLCLVATASIAPPPEAVTARLH